VTPRHLRGGSYLERGVQDELIVPAHLSISVEFLSTFGSIYGTATSLYGEIRMAKKAARKKARPKPRNLTPKKQVKGGQRRVEDPCAGGEIIRRG
jgi:hypothetical protein